MNIIERNKNIMKKFEKMINTADNELQRNLSLIMQYFILQLHMNLYMEEVDICLLFIGLEKGFQMLNGKWKTSWLMKQNLLFCGF